MRLLGIGRDVASSAGFVPFRPCGVPEAEPVLAAATGPVATKAQVPLASSADRTGVMELVFDV